MPCITLRENTEWVETVEDGWNVLVGCDTGNILKAMNEFEPEGEQRDVFWNGDAIREAVVNAVAHRDYESPSGTSSDI